MFKVGDFVRFNNKKVFKVTALDDEWEDGELRLLDGTWDSRHDEPTAYYADECELWKPQSGEWCWFHKFDETNNKNCTIGRFDKMSIGGHYKFWDADDYHCISYMCEPFICELPSFIKGK